MREHSARGKGEKGFDIQIKDRPPGVRRDPSETKDRKKGKSPSGYIKSTKGKIDPTEEDSIVYQRNPHSEGTLPKKK